MNFNKEKIVEQFKKYVYQYDINDESIRSKYFHSLRVMDFAEQIAISENLSSNDIEIAMVSGLLHDYARFEQWKQYHTFYDSKSIDHGDRAVELLFDKNEISNFYLNKENYNVMYDSIKQHNKYEIQTNIINNNLTMCKIIRDADKLDIFNIIIENKNMFCESNDEISEKVRKDFFACKHIKSIDKKNNNDQIVFKLAMIYDINYKYSLNYIIENNVLSNLFKHIENKEIFAEYFEHMQNFLNK